MLNLEIISRLSTLYSEPHRKYHNITHVHACLRELETVLRDAQDHPTIKQYKSKMRMDIGEVIWFHDAYYDPYAPKGYNENQSLELYESVFPMAPEFAKEAILASINHELPKKNMNELTKLMISIFLDIDLSILGKGTLYRHYQNHYSNLIREEYPFTDDKEYAIARKQVVEGFLKRENIYLTKHFRSLYEDRARINLREEIQELNRVIEHGSYLGKKKNA